MMLKKTRVKFRESEIVTFPTTQMMRNLLVAQVCAHIVLNAHACVRPNLVDKKILTLLHLRRLYMVALCFRVVSSCLFYFICPFWSTFMNTTCQEPLAGITSSTNVHLDLRVNIMEFGWQSPTSPSPHQAMRYCDVIQEFIHLLWTKFTQMFDWIKKVRSIL